MRLTKPRIAPLADHELSPDQEEALKPVRGGSAPAPSALAPLVLLETQPEPPWIDPELAAGRALRRVTWLVSEGRAAEARALAKSVEAMERLWAGEFLRADTRRRCP